MEKIFRYPIRAYVAEDGSVRPAEEREINWHHKNYVIGAIQGEHAVNADALFEMTRMELITSRALTTEELGALNSFLMSREFAKFYQLSVRIPYFMIHRMPLTSSPAVQY